MHVVYQNEMCSVRSHVKLRVVKTTTKRFFVTKSFYQVQ